MNIIAFSGSLRKDSYNTALLRAFQEVAGGDTTINIADISTLPLFNQDAEAAFPSEAQALKDRVVAADAVIFATPEYNRSLPGVLKNAIDWISRPYGQNSFARKPVLITGVSGGKIGTALAQSHLRQIMLYLDACLVGQPELYLGPATEIFDERNMLKNESTKELLGKALAALEKQGQR